MYYTPLLLPLFAQVVLVFLVWHRMYFTRISEIFERRIDPQELATRDQGTKLLTRSAPSSDNLKNQFEMPVLFYLAVVLALILMIQDPVLVAFSWLFVGLRYLHSFIHTTYNRVTHRFWVYFSSCVTLMLLWGRLMWLAL